VSHIGPILAALVSLAAVDLGWAAAAPRPWLVLALAAVPWILGGLVRRLAVRGHFRIGSVGERVLHVSPVVLQWIAATSLGWFAFLEERFGVSLSLEAWPGLQLVAGLAPYLVYQLVAIDAGSRLSPHPSGDAKRARNLQLRLFATAFLPLLVYLGFSSLVALSETARVHVEEVSIFSALFTVCLILFLLWFLPRLITHAWETVPIEAGWMREMLESVARRVGFRYRDLLLWRTGRLLSNAAIVGFTPRSRVVLFSDALLTQLRPDELAAVFTHEIGHAKRGHVVTFASWSLVLLLSADLIVTWIGDPSLSLLLGAFAAALLVWYLAFGYMSRRFELEADLESREFFGESSALIRALAAVSGPFGHDRKSWRHFSPARRMRFLQEVDLDPSIGRRLQRRLRVFARAGWVLCALTLVAEGYQLTGEWTRERVTAELRLGRFARADELLEAAQEPLDEESLALVRFAATLPDGLEGGELEERGRAALGQGRAADAVRLVELAILRGRRDLIGVLDTLQPRQEGQGDPSGPVPPEWRALLDR